MEKARAAVSNFVSQSGHHETTVHQNVAPSVEQETVKPERHEQVTTALDKEVHQDHYHTSVQPVQHKEVLPEQHHHNLVGVEHRQVEHDDKSKVAAKLEAERAKFRDQSVTHETKHTTTTAPAVMGEHVHHHVHENIQPVIQKETIQPHVVHTTVPIHEVHHNASQHHEGSVLPAMTMEDFKKHGGTTHGAGEAVDQYEGCPKGFKDPHPTEHRKADSGVGVVSDAREAIAETSGHRHGINDDRNTHDRNALTSDRSAVTGATGVPSTTGAAGVHRPIADEFSKTGARNGATTGTTPNAASAAAASAATAAGSRGATGTAGTAGTGHHHGDSGITGNRDHDVTSKLGHSPSTGSTATSTASHKKPSLMDRLNPKKDADGDGKAGFMS